MRMRGDNYFEHVLYSFVFIFTFELSKILIEYMNIVRIPKILSLLVSFVVVTFDRLPSHPLKQNLISYVMKIDTVQTTIQTVPNQNK